MARKRSRLIIVSVAGTLALAGAISAAAATLPSSFSAASAGAADTHLAVVDRNQGATKATQVAPMSAAEDQMLLFERMRDRGIEWKRAQAAAAAKVAAAKAAARKAAAVKAAAAKAAAAKAAAAKAAAAKAAAAKAAAARAAAARQAAQQAAAQTAAPQAQQQTAQPAAQQPAASAPSGSPEQIAAQMLSQFGWSSSQFSCLQPLWTRESGWNPYAQNPSSGAYGIPQALPGSKMASAGADWQTNPATQIRWGLTYIQSSYGSPCGAWAHEQADGWY